MIKEHLVSASITNGGECICNPEVLFGTNYGMWDFEKEQAPRGALMDLNAAWELFLSRLKFTNVLFLTTEHYKHEVIDGIVYEEGDTTYTLLDDNGLPTDATFTIKANKGPIEHIEWEKGKLYLYYTKLRPLKDSDLSNGAPIHYVKDNEGNTITDDVTGTPLIYDYVTIPVLEIFDNDETRSLFPWYADENSVVLLRDSIDGNNDHLGSFAITPESEVYIAKEVDSAKNLDLVSVQSAYSQLKKDLGIEVTYNIANDYPDPDDGQYHNYRVNGSNLSEKLHEKFNNKSDIVSAINENMVRTRINNRLISDKAVDDLSSWQTILDFADSIKNLAFRDSEIPNLLDALNWILTKEIGPFREEINGDITFTKADGTKRTVDNITEALNSIFSEAEENRDRIGFDRSTNTWIILNTDKNENLTDAINEVDEHINAAADIIDIQEKYNPVTKKTYYENGNIHDIIKNRTRSAELNKEDIKIVEAINDIQNLIGNLSKSRGNNDTDLTTDHKATVVDAINEVDLHSDNNYDTIGASYDVDSNGKKNSDILNLNTQDKSSIVAAINESDREIGNLDELNTESKDNIVNSINEVIKELPFVYEDVNNPESGVVLKDLSENLSKTNHAGDYSLVIGSNNEAAKYSFTNGAENISSGNYTSVNGYKNVSKQKFNTITGKSNYNDGNYNLINGLSNTVNGDNNIVSGSNNTVTSDNSVVLGDNIYGKNADNITAIGNSIVIKDNAKNSTAIGKNSKINGDDSVTLGSSNIVSIESLTIGINNETRGTNDTSIGKDNYISGNKSTIIGDSSSTEGNNDLSLGQNIKITGNNNTILGKNLTIEGTNNIIISNNTQTIRNKNNAIVIGELNNIYNDSTHIAKDIYIQTHDSESKLLGLIFVNLNDWCKFNNASSLNGEKFLDTQHLINALKTYLTHEYVDNALIRFTMLDNNENGFILVQGKSKRIFLNGTWYFTDNIENGWSRHDGEYLKVISNRIVDNNGNVKIKHYLAFMDQLSTDAIVDTVGAQRSNTEDFKNIDLTHAYGAVDFDDINDALDLDNRFNEKVDKYAKVITKYLDSEGATSEKTLNFINDEDPTTSGNIVLSLKDSFGFDKFEYLTLSEKGKKNGYVPLDASGKIDEQFLPSYVDDVIDVWAEYSVDGLTQDVIGIKLYELLNSSQSGDDSEVVLKGEPILIGEKGKIYVEAQPKPGDLSYQFRWTGTKFVAIGAHIVIGETTGTAFDGGRGKAVEDAFDDHLKSGTTSIPLLDELTGRQKIDSDGNPMWVIYKPNPHNVTAGQLEVIVNDPNDPTNITLEDNYPRKYLVDTAIQELFSRINTDEDLNNSIAAILGTAEELDRLDELDEIEGNDSPTIIGTVLSNKLKIESFVPIESNLITNLISENFKLYGED